MSSLNHCIKFELDVKDENIVFKDYFYKSIKLQKHKIYEAGCQIADAAHNRDWQDHQHSRSHRLMQPESKTKEQRQLNKGRGPDPKGTG